MIKYSLTLFRMAFLLGCLICNITFVYAQTDSVDVYIHVMLDGNLNPSGGGSYYRETFDSLGRLIKLESSTNPPNYYPGNEKVVQYDQNGRMVSTQTYNLDASGIKTLKLASTWDYNSSGFLNYYTVFSNGKSDSIVYFRDALGRDTLRIEYDSQVGPIRKYISTYYNTVPATSQLEEFLIDTSTGSWLPRYLHMYLYTTFDSLLTDTIYYFQTNNSNYVLNKLKVNYYDSFNSRIRIETHYYNSGSFYPAECERWYYDPATHLLLSHNFFNDSCTSAAYPYYSEGWNYDSAGKLTYSKILSQVPSCSTSLTDETYYYYDSMGRLSYKNNFRELLGLWCNVTQYRSYDQYLYGNKGVWGATIVAPNKTSPRCEGVSSNVYSLMINEPPDAVSNWSKDGIYSGTGNTFTFPAKANERIGLSAFSPSTNAVLNPPFVVMSVQGSNAYPILYNGSPDDIEKCTDKLVKLVSSSSSLKDFKWYLNGSLMGSSNGSSAVNVVAPGTYRCESVFIAAPNCAHADEIKVENVSPNPILELSGTGIANKKNVLTDVNAEPGSTYKWFKNQVEINGVHDSIINIAGSGTYYCTATSLKNCTSQSPNIQVNLFNSISESDGVWIMNPVRDHQLQVSFDAEIWPPDPTCQWSVTDVDGRLIENGYLNHQNINVNLPLVSGFCFFNIIRDKNVELSKKILVLD
jgi:hypothetical protein